MDSQFDKANIFGQGRENSAFAKFFTGTSYLNPLTEPADGVFMANVTFEPSCRNNWHVHHAAKGGARYFFASQAKAGTGNGASPHARLNPAT